MSNNSLRKIEVDIIRQDPFQLESDRTVDNMWFLLSERLRMPVMGSPDHDKPFVFSKANVVQLKLLEAGISFIATHPRQCGSSLLMDGIHLAEEFKGDRSVRRIDYSVQSNAMTRNRLLAIQQKTKVLRDISVGNLSLGVTHGELMASKDDDYECADLTLIDLPVPEMVTRYGFDLGDVFSLGKQVVVSASGLANGLPSGSLDKRGVRLRAITDLDVILNLRKDEIADLYKGFIPVLNFSHVDYGKTDDWAKRMLLQVQDWKTVVNEETYARLMNYMPSSN